MNALPLLCLTALVGHAGPLAAAPKRALLLTVDDLPIQEPSLHPDPATRRRIMTQWVETLRRYEVPALGFVRTSGMAADAELLRIWRDGGLALGNHSHTHPSLSAMALEPYLEDLERGRAELAQWQGEPVRWFRFPYLREGDTPAKLEGVRAYLARSGQVDVPVTIDTSDWAWGQPWVAAASEPEAREVLRQDYLAHLRTLVRAYARMGDEVLGRDAAHPAPQVLLLHLNQVGADNLDALCRWLIAQGYRFARVEEVMADPAFAQPHAYVAPYGVSHWERLRAARAAARAESEIRTLLADTVSAWNRGDLEAFVAPYAEDARFVTAAGVTVGRAAVLARYRKRYPDARARGRLEITVSEVRVLQSQTVTYFDNVVPVLPRAAAVIGRWRIEREDGAAEGATTLLFERDGNAWVILEDHSS